MRKPSKSVRTLRTRSGCLTCRQRKVKCGEEKPICYNCQRLSKVCSYKAKSYDSSVNVRSNDLDSEQIGNLTYDPAALVSFSEPNWSRGEWGDLLEGIDAEIARSESTGYFADAQQSYVLASDVEAKLKLESIQVPFITPFDSQNWHFFTNHATQLAVSQPTIALSVRALEQISSILMIDGDTADALPQYYAARTAFVTLLKNLAVDIEMVFVATFLLCCCEVLAQQDTIPVTLKQKDSLVTRIEQEAQQPKSPVTRRIIAWLHLFHAKAAHFGGRGLLSPRLLELLNDEDKHIPCLGVEIGNLDSIASSVHQDLFQFYHALQHISIRASRLNRHHRSRVTIDDEIDVVVISCDIEQRLKYLWEGRPAILRTQQNHLVSQEYPLEIDRLGKFCMLAYYAEIIYHARANGRSLELSPDAIAARSAIRSIVIEIPKHDYDSLCDPALIWPLFQYSIESTNLQEVEWALMMMQPISGPLWHADFIKDFVRALTREQLIQQKRVDSRLFCIRYYGMSPAFM